jgi:DNA-binding transcriptional regulator YiaG
MTPLELRKLRTRLGLSTRGLAELVQVSDGRTVRRWEAGVHAVPGPVATLLHLHLQAMGKGRTGAAKRPAKRRVV